MGLFLCNSSSEVCISKNLVEAWMCTKLCRVKSILDLLVFSSRSKLFVSHQHLARYKPFRNTSRNGMGSKMLFFRFTWIFRPRPSILWNHSLKRKWSLIGLSDFQEPVHSKHNHSLCALLIVSDHLTSSQVEQRVRFYSLQLLLNIRLDRLVNLCL